MNLLTGELAPMVSAFFVTGPGILPFSHGQAITEGAEKSHNYGFQ